MADDISTGELGRRIDALAAAMTGMSEKMDGRPSWHDMDRLSAIRDNEQKKQDEAIRDLEGAQTWVFRTSIGALIVGVVGILFRFVGG